MLFAEALAQALIALEADYVFGVSGANIEHLHDAIHPHENITSILAKTEIGAAYMADARARKTRKIAVCCSTSGAGMMNLVVGFAETQAENVPVLANIGHPPKQLEGKGAFQDSSGLAGKMDALQLTGACTKAVIRLTSTDDFWDRFSTLIAAALSGERGPVALLVPRNVFMQDITPLPADWLHSVAAQVVSALPVAQDVDSLLSVLGQASMPLLILGKDVTRSDARQYIDEFALQAGLPTATTMSAKGAFSHYEDSFIGNNGVAGHESVDRYVHQADLIIVVGCKLDVMNRGQVLEAAETGTRVVTINDAAPYYCENSASMTFIKSEPGLFFEQVMKVLAKQPYRYQGSYPDIEFRPFQPVDEGARATDEMSLSLAMKTISPLIGEGEHVLIDAGNTGAAALHFLQLPAKCISTIALGMGGMGYTFAAAVGAQLGTQQRAWVIAGDASFLMGGLEIHCAIEHQLPTLFVVMNDQGHGMCRTRQRVFFDDRFEAVNYSAVNICHIAESLATPATLFSRRVESASALIEALNDYQKQAIPTGIIEILIKQEESPPFAGLPSTSRH
jgi:acetolactate synthase-1/2/3 large subunit